MAFKSSDFIAFTNIFAFIRYENISIFLFLW